MDDIRPRLVNCFQTVFPDLSETAIATARQNSVATWDSVATITLLSVVEDEFGVQFDLERMAEFDSFESIDAYLKANLKAA
jgi:acyl carrier protein